jgi:hypothetical protein
VRARTARHDNAGNLSREKIAREGKKKKERKKNVLKERGEIELKFD